MQLYEIVTLVNELLPPLPDAQGASVASSSNGQSASRSAGRRYSTVTIAGKVEDPVVEAPAEVSNRETLLRNQPELLVQFGIDLFPVLVQVSYF